MVVFGRNRIVLTEAKRMELSERQAEAVRRTLDGERGGVPHERRSCPPLSCSEVRGRHRSCHRGVSMKAYSGKTDEDVQV
jgi:hypothetical protein